MAQAASLKEFFNSFDLNESIGPKDPRYVPNMHGDYASHDVVAQLAAQIDFDLSAQNYVFTGNRGTGKTTELNRLAQLLQHANCDVFHVDMGQYLHQTKPLEISDFIISMLLALDDAYENTFGHSLAKMTFSARLSNFLSSSVGIKDIGLEVGAVGFKSQLKLSLTQDPTFKQRLQEQLRGHITGLIKQAQAFVVELVAQIRKDCSDPNKKVVLIVDSVEQIRGIGEEAVGVYRSMENLFAANADNLRFSPMHIVYTVPPYLQVLIGGVIYQLPSVHVFKARSRDDDADGQNRMLQVVQRRVENWPDFIEQSALLQFARDSGGDIREFFRLLRGAASIAAAVAGSLGALSRSTPSKIPAEAIDRARQQIRSALMPIAEDDLGRLGGTFKTYKPPLKSQSELPILARLTETKHLLNYRNGDDWWGVHPLIWDVIEQSSATAIK